MPLVKLYRGRRIHKAKRLKWQDIRPETQEGRDAYRIAAKYQDTFTRTFMNLARNALPEEMPKAYRDAWKSKSVSQVLQSLPEPDIEKFSESLIEDYSNVIQAAGDESTKDINEEFKSNIKFTIEKAERIVPVNPYSIDWMKERATGLITQGITKPQREVVRDILESSFEQGLRAEETYNTIRANIGLTARDNKAVERRLMLHLGAGIAEDKAEILTGKYKDKLLKTRAQRIARTETIAAQSQGRLASWKIAQESGTLPQVRRIWLTPPPSPNPNSPCPICLDLDGKNATLNGTYESIEGEIAGPPAHPDCRCTETIEKVK